MAFTPVTVTNNYDLPNGLDPTGSVSFTPSAPMVNGTTVVAAKVSGKLDVDGKLSINLVATTDPGTTPANTLYLVEESINGASRSGYVALPHTAGSTVDLSTLSWVAYTPPPARPTLTAVPAEAAWLTLLAAKQPLSTLLTRMATAPVTVTYATSITLNASLGCVFRVTAAGDLTLADITGGVDGQTVALEVLASGGTRLVAITGGGSSAVAAGQWWTATFRYNSAAATWLLL